MTRPDPFAPLRATPSRAAVISDFDGSLARIVDDPAAARAVEGATAALETLVAAFGLVAVVSGRPVGFLRKALPVDGVALAGLYGMERLVGGEVVVDPAVEPFLDAVADAAVVVERELPGLRVERKSGVSFVMHWREAPDREDEALVVGRAVADRYGLTADPGRRSLEVRPPVPVDKGSTVRSLVEGMEAALFAGDDRGDLAAFEALDALVATGSLRHGVKVAVLSDEAPSELVDAADERVDGPEELVRVLASLAEGASAR